MHRLGRRDLLKLGAAAIVGAVAVPACSKNANSGDRANRLSADDLAFLRTATSLDLLAVNAYESMLGTALVTDSNVATLATLFRGHHSEHAQQLAAATVAGGGVAYAEPNAVLAESVVSPSLDALTDQASVIGFASTLESLLAETYAYAAGLLTTPALRQLAMTLGAPEARHVAIWSDVLGVTQVPAALLPTADHVPASAWV